MPLKSLLQHELEAELRASHAVLERVPEDHFDFRPHEKSWNMKQLATHVANLVSWGAPILGQDELDLGDMAGYTPPNPQSTEEIVGILTGHGEAVRAQLEGLSEEQLEETWTLKMGDHVISAMPRGLSFGRFVLAHGAHHRGQLTVYLRLNDIPVPQTFGPTADEPDM